MARNWRSNDPRGRTRPAVVGALVLGLAATAIISSDPRSDRAGDARTYVVTVASGAADHVAGRLDADGIAVIRRLGSLDMLVIEAAPSELDRIAGSAQVVGVSADATVSLTSDGYSPYDPADDANSMFNVANASGAHEAWKGKKGVTGAGIGVAIIDSGISPVVGLDAPGKIINGIDLSYDAAVPGLAFLDAFGHGTHMAGIIAGRDAGADPQQPLSETFMGVAPDAHLINVKVADAVGAVDVSQIIAGIDWVIEHKDAPGMNIRVLNLSLGMHSNLSYLDDPLAYAAQRAWLAGIVVVVSVGNDGDGSGGVLNPAIDPYVIAVGAADTRGTKSVKDDVIPPFSSRGDGTRNPDLVAHGTSVQSLRVPGSFLDGVHGASATLGDRFFRGSGTSQAAAVVSGTVALAFEQRPDLTPDQVKALLMDNAQKLPKAHAQAQGKGLVNLRKLDDKVPSKAAQKHARATGRGGDSIGAATTSQPSSGEMNARTWAGGTWNARTWAGGYWTARTWAGDTWSSRTWAGGGWG